MKKKRVKQGATKVNDYDKNHLTKPKLKPCQFCGAEPGFEESGDSVWCSNGSCQVNQTDVWPVTSIAKWNTRPVDVVEAQKVGHENAKQQLNDNV